MSTALKLLQRTPDAPFAITAESVQANTAEGYANGATVTTGTSGGASGDQLTPTGTVTATTADFKYGSVSYEHAAVVASNSYVSFTLPGPTRYLSVHRWVKLTGYPTSNCEWIRAQAGVGGPTVGVNLTTAGRILSGQTPFPTSGGSVLPLNVWWREEFWIDQGGGPGAGELHWRAYDGASSLIGSLDHYGSSGTASAFTIASLGKRSTAGDMALWRQDDLRVATNRLSELGDGTLALTGTATLSGDGTLSTTEAPAIPGAATLTGSGTLSSSATVAAAGAAALSGAGTLSTTGRPTSSTTATLSGAGTLGAVGVAGYAVAAALSGAGALSSTQTPRPAVAAGLSGAGTLSSSQTPRPAAAATLAGSGTLSTAASLTAAAVATLAGAGTLSSAQAPRPAQTAALSGTGTLSSSATPAIAGTASLTGSGTLVGGGSAPGAGSANLAGTGTLSASSTPRTAVTAALSGAGVLASSTVPRPAIGVTLTGAGTLSASSLPRVAVGVSLAGSGTLGLASTLTLSGLALLAGEGALSASGAVPVFGTAHELQLLLRSDPYTLALRDEAGLRLELEAAALQLGLRSAARYAATVRDAGRYEVLL